MTNLKAATEAVPLSRELEIVNKRGLHARASAKFVKCVERFDAKVSVTRLGETVGGHRDVQFHGNADRADRLGVAFAQLPQASPVGCRGCHRCVLRRPGETKSW